MRVVNVKHIKSRQKKREKQQRRKRLIVGFSTIALLAVLVTGGWQAYYFLLSLRESNRESAAVNENTPVETIIGEVAPSLPSKETNTLIELDGNAYRDLYRSVNYPNVASFDEPPHITGNKNVDEAIRKIAERRGFVLTGRPVAAISHTDGQLVADTKDNLLQPLAKDAWLKLRKLAKESNMPLLLSSGYRSVERQRQLFLDRLYATGVTDNMIITGLGDAAIQETLYMTAPPGYSRHHTGYTIDLFCDDGSGPFVDSSCYQWIKSDDYRRIKELGWIPSYPEDAVVQGPEPEPWEYVWVGTRHLYQ